MEAELNDFNDKGSAVVDIEGLVYRAIETLQNQTVLGLTAIYGIKKPE